MSGSAEEVMPPVLPLAAAQSAPPPGPATPEQWARQIAGAWRRGLEAVLKTGRLLAEARRQLGDAQWRAMVEEGLPFGARHAQRLIAIGADSRLTTHVSQLPADTLALYQLTRLEDGELEAWAADGRLNPAMGRGEVTGRVKRARRELREVELAGRAGAASLAAGEKRYGALYADPPWKYEAWSELTGQDRGAGNHYPTMTVAEIAALAVPAAEDAVLFLWALAAMLPEALRVMGAWGFDYRSHIVWDKGVLGLGYWVRTRHELLLIGTRGAVPAPAPGTQPESVIQEPASGPHSAKPALFRGLVERLYPTTPKLELFCRGAPAEGWDGWGNEAEAGNQEFRDRGSEGP